MLDQDGGKWYLLVPYQQPKPETPKLDKRKSATLEPGIDCPWLLTVAGRTIRLKRSAGRLVAWHRKRLFSARSIRNAAYREGQSGKGHGRGRFFARLSNRLAGFKATFSKQSAHQAAEILVEHGVGKLIYAQPADGAKCFLTEAGVQDSWPWHVVKAELKRRCEERGIVLTTTRWEPADGERPSDAKTPGSARSGGTVDGSTSCGDETSNGASSNGRNAKIKPDRSQNGRKTPQKQGRRKAPVARDE